MLTQLHVNIKQDNTAEVILDTRNLDVQSIADHSGQALSYDIAKEHKVSSMRHQVSPPIAALIIGYAICRSHEKKRKVYAVRHFNHAVRHDGWEALDRPKATHPQQRGTSCAM